MVCWPPRHTKRRRPVGERLLGKGAVKEPESSRDGKGDWEQIRPIKEILLCISQPLLHNKHLKTQ